MIDRPGRGLLRRAPGCARAGGRPGGGDRGGGSGACGRGGAVGWAGGGVERVMGGSPPGGHGGQCPLKGGAPAKVDRTHIWMGSWVMLLQTAAVCPGSAPRTSTTRRQRPLPGAAKRCIFIFAMAAAH